MDWLKSALCKLRIHRPDAMLHAGADKAHEYYERSREKAVEFEEQIEKYIREKPLQSVLIAAGVGVALGLLLRR